MAAGGEGSGRTDEIFPVFLSRPSRKIYPGSKEPRKIREEKSEDSCLPDILGTLRKYREKRRAWFSVGRSRFVFESRGLMLRKQPTWPVTQASRRRRQAGSYKDITKPLLEKKNPDSKHQYAGGY